MSWQDSLYTYGYLLTSDEQTACKQIPELKDWALKRIRNYALFVHPRQEYFLFESQGCSFLLVGHAYNPFAMTENENQLLAMMASLKCSPDEYRDYFDQLTGAFFYAVIDESGITATCDCAGMLGANYAVIGDASCFSAYSQMIADIYDLKEDQYVTKLKRSKLFHWYGWYLPGDLTPYSEIKRIIPNTEVTVSGKVSINRFYPRKPYAEVNEQEYAERVKEIGTVVNNSLKLITQKWSNPAISLTGGMDSKTTLACAKGLQDRFSYFSYVSLPREETDALAAQSICKALQLKHRIYWIDAEPSHHSEFEEVSALISRHYAYLGKANKNDVCKRIVLKAQFENDVEVKSWVAEVARASRYRKYGRSSFPRHIRPRMLTSMYKVFLFNRLDAVKTDNMFKEYLEKSGLKEAIEETGYPWTEFFVWEIVFGGWGGLALTGEHMISNNVTVPYNNRALLDLMLRTPLGKRIDDQLQKDIINRMDDRIEKTGIHVVNGNETKQRELFERAYYAVNNLLPW